MRYNPTKDCSVYFEWPNPWDIKPWFIEPPPKKWKPKVYKPWEKEDFEFEQKTIPYWRDLAKIGKTITDRDLRFNTWPAHRRKDANQTRLPDQHCYGGRFIKLTMDFPLGWRYRNMPMNLQEIQIANKKQKAKGKKEKKAKGEAKKKGKKGGKGGKKSEKKGKKK